jgi:hypothetical protein
MANSIALNSIRYITIDFVGSVLYWPIWWYSKGLWKILIFCLTRIQKIEARLGLKIWLKNIFTPMFGQYDLESRLISFFVRLSQIIIKLIILILGFLLMILIFLLYLILPLIIIYQIGLNFSSLFQ